MHDAILKNTKTQPRQLLVPEKTTRLGIILSKGYVAQILLENLRIPNCCFQRENQRSPDYYHIDPNKKSPSGDQGWLRLVAREQICRRLVRSEIFPETRQSAGALPIFSLCSLTGYAPLHPNTQLPVSVAVAYQSHKRPCYSQIQI